MEQTSTEAKNIHEALLYVMGEAWYVQKTQSKDGGIRYTFASEAATIESCRQPMMKHKVVMHCAGWEQIQSTQFTAKSGGHMELVRVKARWVFTHVPSGTYIEVESIGDGADSGDKGVYKAMTGALKYALRQTLLLQTGDDAEDTLIERADKNQAKKQMARTQVLKKASDAIMKATDADHINSVLADPRVIRYPSVLSELSALAQRRIAELS